MNTPVREGETIEGSRTMRNRPYQVLKCSSMARRACIEPGQLVNDIHKVESEPQGSETCDDEGVNERDRSASADDEMAFIDDAFFELPDAATEGEAEGGEEGSQSSQGSRRTAHRRSRTNRQAAERFMDRLSRAQRG